MTRSFIAMAHGDLTGAFAAHPCGPLLFVGTAAMVMFGTYQAATGKTVLGALLSRISTSTWTWLAALFAAAWLARLMLAP